METQPTSRRPHGGGAVADAALALGGVVGFVLLALLVAQGGAAAFDAAVLEAVRPAGASRPWWLTIVVRDVTALGGRTLLAAVAVVAAVGLALDGRREASLLVGVAAAGALLLGPALKELVPRARPDVAAPGVEVRSLSFPSAHAFQAAAFWLVLGPLLARLARRRAARVWALAATVLVVAAVGASRVLLGVHFPTDVLAGWSAGAAWAAACRLGAAALARGDRL